MIRPIQAVMEHAIFDWNRGLDGAPDPLRSRAQAVAPPDDRRAGPDANGVHVVDETLRDGLQNGSGKNPPIAHKVDLLHAMARIGVDVVSVGLPAAGERHAEDTFRLCREIQDARLPLHATAAARTVVADVQGIARTSERVGMPIEVYSFIGSSPIRHYTEEWDMAFLVESVRRATEEAIQAGLSFCLVTEDATRAHPDTLRTLFRTAIDAGATRLCLCDTTGHATPHGVTELIRFTRGVLGAIGARDVKLDWHAHNDRGLGIATALRAASEGVDRVHGTGLGVGERAGNTSLELLVQNLGLLGARPLVARARLIEYCELAARALSWPIPADHPLAGSRFREEQALPRAYRVVTEAPAARPIAIARATARASDRLVPMSLFLGGSEVALAVHPRRTLLEALRYDLDLIGTKQGCDKGDCGACTVVLDGKAVLACLTLALDADGRAVETVETIGGAHLDPLVDCFDRVGGGQCGFCTPGMLMSATALLERSRSPSRAEITLAISGNLCRCTGYGRIVDAIELAARIRRGEAPSGVDLPGSECAPPPLRSNAPRGRGEKG